MGLRKKSSRLFRKNLSVLLSATMLVGSVSMTDGLTADAAEATAGYSVSSGDTVSDGDAVSGGNLLRNLLLAPQALTALGRSVAGTASYADFTADEVIYSLNFGTDVTKDTTYEQRNVGTETVCIGFADEEYKNEATGWSGNVYYPRTVSRQEP